MIYFNTQKNNSYQLVGSSETTREAPLYSRLSNHKILPTKYKPIYSNFFFSSNSNQLTRRTVPFSSKLFRTSPSTNLQCEIMLRTQHSIFLLYFKGQNRPKSYLNKNFFDLRGTNISAIRKENSSQFPSNSTSSFDFTEYIRDFKPQHIKDANPDFLAWFIGFAEGDGTWYVKHEAGCKPRLVFEICQNDPKPLYRIKKTLGFGSVNQTSHDNQIYWKYYVSSLDNVYRLFYLFNGNLIFPRRRVQFTTWVKSGIESGCFPETLPLRIDQTDFTKVSFHNAWLSGFIDADGGFAAHLSTPSQRSLVSKSLKTKFYITQKCEVDGDEAVLERIGDICLSKASVCPLTNTWYPNRATTPYRRIEISGLNSHCLLVDYLTQYKLKTARYIAFHRWSRIIDARTKNQHLQEPNIPRLGRLCKSINKSAVTEKVKIPRDETI